MANAIALHIGVNKVNPEHYMNEQGEAWRAELAAAERDAQDLALLSESQGFTSRMLLGEDATAENVIESLQFASEVLESGDALLVSFAGYGSQVPDRFTEQETHLDESWCLYDRQLIDDELYACWARFKPGVRILLLSDCCHNEKVARRPMFAAVSKPGGPVARLLPDAEQRATYARHQRLYDDLQREHPDGEHVEVKASVIVIQACQDNQIAFDGADNGLFTGTMLRVWDQGNFKGSLIHFWRSIIDQMPMYQCPNLLRVGVQSSAFEQQRPFSVGAPEGPAPVLAEQQPLPAEVVSALEPQPSAPEQPAPPPAKTEPVRSAPIQPVVAEQPAAPRAEPARPAEPHIAAAPAAVSQAVPPREPAPAPDKPLRTSLDDEWLAFMKNGFGSVQGMLKQNMESYMRSYHITLGVYATIFGLGLALMVLAVVLGLTSDRLAVALAFGALSIATLVFFFMLQPIQALEENLAYISMLGVAINNYWARLMHISGEGQVQNELKAAADDYNAAVAAFQSRRARRQSSAEPESPLNSAASAPRPKRKRGLFASAPVLKSIGETDSGVIPNN